MNKSLVILAILIILGGGAFITWQILNGSDEETSSSNSTSVNESTSALDSGTSDNTAAPQLTQDVVSEYNTAESCWTIIDGNVYDVTSYVPRHPGGIGEIVKACGKDGTSLFESVSDHERGGARGILEEYYLGPLEG
jgi:cytochrome b involved in lipid metabolism